MNNGIIPVEPSDSDITGVRVFTKASGYDPGVAVRCEAAEFLSPDDFPAEMFEGVRVDAEPVVVSLWPSTFKPRHTVARGDRIVQADGVQWLVIKLVREMAGMRIDCACLRHAHLARPV